MSSVRSAFFCVPLVKLTAVLVLSLGTYIPAATSTTEFALISSNCGEQGDCLSLSPVDCEHHCRCNNSLFYSYNPNTNECMVNLKRLMLSMIEKYNSQDYDFTVEDELAKKISKEADKVFQGILISVLLFIACASICVLGACFYCFRIHYIDYRLKKEVKTIAKRLGKGDRVKRQTIKKPTQPHSESCNVIVEDAGVFVV